MHLSLPEQFPLLYFDFFSLQVSLLSNLGPDTRGKRWSLISSHLFSCALGEWVQFISVLLLSCFWLFVMPWTAACQTSLSITNSQILLKLMSIKSVMSSNRFILCRPLFLPPSVFPSIRVFSSEFFASGSQMFWTFYKMLIHDDEIHLCCIIYNNLY